MAGNEGRGKIRKLLETAVIDHDHILQVQGNTTVRDHAHILQVQGINYS